MIRSAVAADVEAVAALEAGCFPDPWPPDYLAQGIAGELPTVSMLVAEADATVVGYAIVSVAFEIAELQRVAVSAAARGHGIGASLVDAAAGLAASQGAERLLLEVREDNVAALRLYRATGFTEIDRRPAYYRDGTTAVVLQLDLTGTMAR